MEQGLMILLLLVCGIASTSGAIWVMRRYPAAPPVPQSSCIFLLRGDKLADSTPQAAALFAALPEQATDRERLMRHFNAHFPDLSNLSGLEETGFLRFHSGDGAMLLAEDMGAGVQRLTFEDISDENGFCHLAHRAQARELTDLREAVDSAPMLSWREDAQGRVIWANAAYFAQADQSGNELSHWPLPRLFDLPPVGDGAALSPRRARLPWPEDGQWFDCHAVAAQDGRLCFALPADAAVRAERSLREFVQTLTKTFADLPIGLAIFDRHRNLQLFNPALIDLTGLATGFLTARPTLYAFLDRLREARMVPEPKNYRSWREQMATLEAAAASGYHVETWSLPGGQTYRVTGRPHPDGAVAFLFEDITSEITLTRKFRAEVALGTRVLDALEDAVIVFAPNGEVELTNQAYRKLWQDKPAGVQGSLGQWQPEDGGNGWDRLSAMLASPGSRDEGSGIMAGPNGTLLRWRVQPLPRGERMVSFAHAVSEPMLRQTAPTEPAEAEQSSLELRMVAAQ